MRIEFVSNGGESIIHSGPWKAEGTSRGMLAAKLGPDKIQRTLNIGGDGPKGNERTPNKKAQPP